MSLSPLIFDCVHNDQNARWTWREKIDFDGDCLFLRAQRVELANMRGDQSGAGSQISANVTVPDNFFCHRCPRFVASYLFRFLSYRFENWQCFFNTYKECLYSFSTGGKWVRYRLSVSLLEPVLSALGCAVSMSTWPLLTITSSGPSVRYSGTIASSVHFSGFKGCFKGAYRSLGQNDVETQFDTRCVMFSRPLLLHENSANRELVKQAPITLRGAIGYVQYK